MIKQRIAKKIVLFLITILVAKTHALLAQKVGVVLSGGGASGLSHVGVLKALEENKVPIHYITGTSMGALVGACYASGMSPKEIEEKMSDPVFIGWAKGIIEDKYQYFFKRKENNASWISFKFSPDTVFETSLPTNFINPVAIDFALMEYFSPTTAAANYNFDSLFIPYRCVAADIEKKQPVIFKNGNLSQAIRASMSYPLYIRPIKVNGVVMFDGGLYNNFPADVMYQDFNPDIIIGSDISDANPKADEDNVLSQIKAMIIARNNNTRPCGAMIVIRPSSPIMGLFNFEDVKEIIQVGYNAALSKMDSILSLIPVRENLDSLALRRKIFESKKPPLLFDNVYISGLNKYQINYAKRILKVNQKKEGSVINIEKLKYNFYRLASDDKIKAIYPLAYYNPKTNYYDLFLDVKKEKKLTIEFGGVFSSKPINTGYVGLDYHYLRNVSYTLSGNSYFGKLYGSAQIKLRVDYPTKIPFYSEIDFTNNRLDFFKSYATFFEDVRPSYLIINDLHGEFTIGIPTSRKSRIRFSGGFGEVINQYYQTKQFTRLDTVDKTYFDGNFLTFLFERNTLDQKQYASNGTNFSLKAKYFSGIERFIPGSTGIEKTFARQYRQWFNVRLLYQNFIIRSKFYRVGYYLEGVYSNQPFFTNYTSTILSAPVFNPIPESKALFLPNFRAHQFGAFGILNIIKLPKNFDWRIEGYVFQPYQRIIENEFLDASYNPPLVNRFYIASTGLVFNSPIGPAAIMLNYYNNDPKFNSKIDKYSIIFTFGYIIHNKKMFD